MNGSYVCRVCLTKDDLEIIFKKDNEDLLSKLRLIGRIPVGKDDLLPQCLCRSCAHELQIAYDLVYQYEATNYKLKKSRLLQTRTKKEKNAMIENVKIGAPTAISDSSLVPEIVVKEEVFSDDDVELHRLESKVEPKCSKPVEICVVVEVDGNDDVKGIKITEFNSEGCLKVEKRSNELRPNVEDKEDLNRFSDDELSVISYPMSDDAVDPAESSELSKVFKVGTPELREAVFEAVKDPRRATERNEANSCAVDDERLHDDEAPKKSLCEDGTGLSLSEHLKSGKLHTSSTKESTSIIRTKLEEYTKSSECFNRLKINTLQENAVQVYSCDKCDRKFKRLKSLKEHQNLHLNPDAVECKQCYKKFSRKQNLIRHEKRHLNPQPYSCDKCGKRFSELFSMKEHQILHSNPDAFKCEQCGTLFSSNRKLRDHKFTHSNPELFTCEKCDSKFKTMISLKEHQNIHLNPDAFKCEECDKRFLSQQTLKEHKITHSNPALLTCELCDKSFSFKSSLKMHQRVHSDDYGLKCEECGKRCSSSSVLRRHKVKHLIPKPFKCARCNKMFKSMKALTAHQISHLNPDVMKYENAIDPRNS